MALLVTTSPKFCQKSCVSNKYCFSFKIIALKEGYFLENQHKKDFENSLKLVSSQNKKEIAKGIALAAVIEWESIEFYSAQEKKFSLETDKKFFAFLVEQEKTHLSMINGLKAALEANKKWSEPDTTKMNWPEIFPPKDWDKQETDGALTAILFALWKEKQAREFYLGIAEKAKDKAIQKFFLHLAGFEKSHAELLESFVDNSFYTQDMIMG